LKKAACILILFCFIAPFPGSIAWYQLQKKEIRKEVKQKIKAGMTKEELVILTFLSSFVKQSLRWENAGEFEYNGQMYDVVKTEIHGDTIHFWCFLDHKESALTTRIKELIAKITGNHPQNRENQKRLITFLKTFYLPDHFAWTPDNFNKNHNYPSSGRLLYCSGFFEPSIPPPRVS